MQYLQLEPAQVDSTRADTPALIHTYGAKATTPAALATVFELIRDGCVKSEALQRRCFSSCTLHRSKRAAYQIILPLEAFASVVTA